MKPNLKSLLTLVTLTATALVAGAQEPANPANPATPTTPERQDREGRRGGDDRRGNFEEFRQRMNERLKTSLQVTDEEWSVLQPLIEKVNEKQREAGGSRFGGFGGGGPGGTRRGPEGGTPATSGGDQGSRPERPGAAESQALRTALENESTSPEELKAKLTALREVRKKGTAELAAAREELRKVVSVRQEAVLVSMGTLE